MDTKVPIVHAGPVDVRRNPKGDQELTKNEGLREQIDEKLELREKIYATLRHVANALGLQVERSQVELDDSSGDCMDSDDVPRMVRTIIDAGKQLGISIVLVDMNQVDDVYDIVRDGFPVLLAKRGGVFHILQRIVGGRFESICVGDSVGTESMSWRQVQQLLNDGEIRVMVARDPWECGPISAPILFDDGHGHSGHHTHVSPLTRFIGLLWLDARDIGTIFLFSSVAGTLALATPLAVESLVNVVSWGTYLQPLLVLALMLLACLGLSGVLRVLQTVVVEIIQRRQFVRFVSDFAHRFPRANRRAISGEHPRELANRAFDIMTIQKSTAVLLLDGVSILLTTVLGMILLAAYHPFLLGFDIVLLISMVSITWVLGRSGVRTAIDESVVKYRVVHWLQDVLDQPTAFRTNGGEALAVDHASRLVADYLEARKSQFRVVIRQVAFAVGLQVLASTVLLGLGGWLVVQGQLTLGQLVASELVVTVVVGAFAKAGKSLEKFYDLMAGIDKIGHLLDIQVDPQGKRTAMSPGPAVVRWDALRLENGAMCFTVPAANIVPGSRVAILDYGTSGKSSLLSALAGLMDPLDGLIEIDGHEAASLCTSTEELAIGFAGPIEVFRGTVRQNVDLGRMAIGRSRVREVLQQVGLWDSVARLDRGVDSFLQSGGYPLTKSQASQLMLARAIAHRPKLLIIDGLLDDMSLGQREHLWQTIGKEHAPWTLIIATNREDVASLCDSRVVVEMQR